MEFDVRKDGSVMASFGETFEFSVLIGKLANLGREPNAPEVLTAIQR